MSMGLWIKGYYYLLSLQFQILIMSGIERALNLKNLPRVTLGNIKALPGQRLRVIIYYFMIYSI